MKKSCKKQTNKNLGQKKEVNYMPNEEYDSSFKSLIDKKQVE